MFASCLPFSLPACPDCLSVCMQSWCTNLSLVGIKLAASTTPLVSTAKRVENYQSPFAERQARPRCHNCTSSSSMQAPVMSGKVSEQIYSECYWHGSLTATMLLQAEADRGSAGEHACEGGVPLHGLARAENPPERHHR